MSKTSWFFIVVIVAALGYMGAVRWQEWRAALQEAQEMADRQDGEPFSFQQVPVALAAPQAEPLQDPVLYRPPYPEVYLEDTPLTADQQRVQAHDTITSILADFKNDPALVQFQEEMQQATQGQVQGLEDLSTQNLAQIIQQNPQIAGVVEKHLKKPDFAKLIQEVFQNPQFQKSVQDLQQSRPNAGRSNSAISEQ